MKHNDNIVLAIQTLLDNKKEINARSISELSGIQVPIIYKCKAFRPFVRFQKKQKAKSAPVKTSKVVNYNESIEQTEEGYRNFITDSYFFHPETVGEVKQDMLASLSAFSENIFNNAMMAFMRRADVVEAKPRGKDDIARYVWAKRLEIEAPATPLPVEPSLQAIMDEWKEMQEDEFFNGSQSEAIKALHEVGKVHLTEKEPDILIPNAPQIKLGDKSKTVSYKRGFRKEKVIHAAAALLHRIAEYVTADWEDDPQILKLEEFARATLKKIQKVA